MNLEMSDIVFLGIVLVVGAVALIVGAALGAYSAFRQTKDDEAKAWDKGYVAAVSDIDRFGRPGLYTVHNTARTLNPHRLRGPFPRGTKTDAPHV